MQDDAIAFVLALGRALHRYGTPAHRLEEGLRVCCDRLGLLAEIFTTPTTIIMSFGQPTELRTRMMRVEGGEVDLGKLAKVDEVADQVATHAITASEGVARLDVIIASPARYGRALSTLAYAACTGMFALFFGGGLADLATAAAIGLAVGVLAQVAQRSTDQARVFELVGSAFAAFAAGVAAWAWPSVQPSIVTVAALLVLLPGLSLTVAMTELATRNLIAGTARLMSAVIVLLELVIGVAIGDRIAAALVTIHSLPPAPLPTWTLWLALIVSCWGVTVLFQAPARAFGWIVAASVTAYVGSRYGTAWLGGQLGALVGAVVLGVLSNLYARWLGRPAQVVQVPAVLLLVPGSIGFRGMESLLDANTLPGVATVFAMFVAATAIVAGLLVANAMVSPRRSL
ncbi:MAG TPA: threonine/serine exporter family protein [Kofleriaceae bacterium]|jgi:uncharacterized membrane protein YjjP (DUF1212 family)